MAALLLRQFTAFVLVYGTQDNVFSQERMAEFAGFLAQHRFPWPTASAHLSAYAQSVGGIFLAVGFPTRPVGFVIAVNFVVALAMVHVGQPMRHHHDLRRDQESTRALPFPAGATQDSRPVARVRFTERQFTVSWASSVSFVLIASHR